MTRSEPSPRRLCYLYLLHVIVLFRVLLQVTASFRVVDGIVLVVDAVEGVMLNVSGFSHVLLQLSSAAWLCVLIVDSRKFPLPHMHILHTRPLNQRQDDVV